MGRQLLAAFLPALQPSPVCARLRLQKIEQELQGVKEDTDKLKAWRDK